MEKRRSRSRVTGATHDGAPVVDGSSTGSGPPRLVGKLSNDATELLLSPRRVIVSLTFPSSCLS